MKPEAPTPRELERLLQDLEDGWIGEEDHALLMELLVTDAGVRAAYCEHMSFASALHDESVARIGLGAEQVVPPRQRQRRVIWGSMLAAAAAVAGVAAVLSVIAARGAPPARVAATPEAVWRFEAGGLAEGSDFLPDSRLIVDHGTVEVSFSSGTRVYLEGPMQAEIRDARRVYLADGAAWCEVAEGDEGFTVLTDRLRVIDLGTRFGVRSSPWGDQVHVGEGRVRVESRLPGIEGRELKGGEAIAADVLGKQREIALDRESFHRDLKTAPPHFHWSFDGPDPLAVADGSGAGRLAVRDGGGARDPVFGPGVIGRSLDLSAGDVLAESDFQGFGGGVPRTIAFWIKGKPVPAVEKADGEIFQPPVIGWGRRVTGGKWHLCLAPDGKALGTVWGSAWTTSIVPDGASLLDDRWHHVASVFTGRYDPQDAPEIIHYVDGRRVDFTSHVLAHGIDTQTDDRAEHALFVGGSRIREVASGPLPLMIDELHVVRAALREVDIRRLAGRPDEE